jgi:signal transduction histidine kinase
MEEKKDSIARIASTIAHELRNPLAVLNNSLYFIRAKIDNEALDPKVRKHLGFMGEAIKNLEAEIERLPEYLKNKKTG